MALERDEIRAKQRARLATDADRRRRALREEQSSGMRNIVERLDLQAALADEGTSQKLKVAGFRGQSAADALPVLPPGLAVCRLFAGGDLSLRRSADCRPAALRQAVRLHRRRLCRLLCADTLCQQSRHKRKQSIQLAWPDALDLMLICVESGMSVEAALRKVADEIGAQSVALAEELSLTNAELSYLQERKAAYENLASRTGLESVKSVSPGADPGRALRHAGGHALRVLARKAATCA